MVESCTVSEWDLFVLQHILTQWLANAARQKIQEQAIKAARTQLEGGAVADQEQPAYRLRSCDVGVVFALGIEGGGLEDLLDGVVLVHGGGFKSRQGGFRGRHVVLLESGAGREAARRGTAALIVGHRPQWIVSAGFCGGLQPQVRRGDIVMANNVADLEGRRLAIDLRMSPESLAGLRGVHVGRMLTVDRIIRTPAEKRELGQQHHALAVDMETSAVAETCASENVRFLAIRIVSDAIDDELPPDLDRLIQQPTTVGRLGAALGAIVNRPSSIKDMLKLKEDALVCSDKLAKFMSGVIEQLAPVKNAG